MSLACEPRFSEGRPGLLKSDELASFFTMLGALTSAGVPLTRSLDGLRQQPTLAGPLTRALEALHRGHGVASSFSKGGFRDPLMLGLLQVGERTGCIDSVVDRLAELYRWRSNLSAELRSRLVYPAILCFCCALLVGLGPPLLLRPVLEFIAAGGDALPPATVALMALLNVLASPWPWLLLVGLGAAFLHQLRLLLRRCPEAVERFLLERTPVGACLSLLFSVRFGRALLTCLSSGYPLLSALALAGACSGSALLTKQLGVASSRLMAGDSLEQAFSSVSVLDSLLRQSLCLGLESGDVETMMGSLLALQEERLRFALDRLLTLLEPLVVAFMGGLVGFSMLATVVPMMSLLQGVP